MPTGTEAEKVRPPGPTSKISRVLSGVLTAKTRDPSGDKMIGRTCPLSKATNADCAKAIAGARLTAKIVARIATTLIPLLRTLKIKTSLSRPGADCTRCHNWTRTPRPCSALIQHETDGDLHRTLSLADRRLSFPNRRNRTRVSLDQAGCPSEPILTRARTCRAK